MSFSNRLHTKYIHASHNREQTHQFNKKIMHQSYEQAYTESSNDNTCKIKQNNNKKSIRIAIETANCLALHHISTKKGKKKK